MRDLLVINPNTTEAITRLLQEHVQREVGSGFVVRAVTARFGAPYIADEASYAVAAHAVLDVLLPPPPGEGWGGGAAAFTAPGAPPSPPSPGGGRSKAADAVLIGCFGDPGLFALRESSPVPVTGLAEASFIEAARHGRFAIVTGGARWEPMLRRLAQALGFDAALAGIHTVAPTGAELAADRDGARALLAQACAEATRRFDARAVIVGGAALAGMAAELQGRCAVPLIDSVAAGARRIAAALRD
ncbi:aspartate/glutamate racemase family protein [Ramlibacter sp.]|uniref:aspartate/glutamate racemase family protein n=1 Tax=Ramlibacter sp. TaxID=1917967 RepID=UPI002632FF56|nr:aspartate/glutamate racemase family protein [Ramlibacter sp.]